MDDEYHEQYPEIAPIKKKNSRRRNRKSSVIRAKRQKLLARDPHCQYCRKPLSLEDSTLDHVIPLSKGGSSLIENLAVACGDCNNKKGNNINYRSKQWTNQK